MHRRCRLGTWETKPELCDDPHLLMVKDARSNRLARIARSWVSSSCLRFGVHCALVDQGLQRATRNDQNWFPSCLTTAASRARLSCSLVFQEIIRPDVFWYEAATKVDLPINPLGLVAFEAFAMHYVEVRRGQDLKKPGSVNQDPIFKSYSLPDHEVGAPHAQVTRPIGTRGQFPSEALGRPCRQALMCFPGFILYANSFFLVALMCSLNF